MFGFRGINLIFESSVSLKYKLQVPWCTIGITFLANAFKVVTEQTMVRGP